MLFDSGFDPKLLRHGREKDEYYYARLRRLVDPNHRSGEITRERVERVLRQLSQANSSKVSVVVALLDEELPNGYSQVQERYPFSAGASVSHLFCHAGILQHGGTKIDRESRDYLVKPLVELGTIEHVYLDSKSKTFSLGHGKAKSPNNCYRLTAGFRTLLSLPEEELESALEQWASEDAARERAKFQAEAAARVPQINNPHADLIQATIDIYALRFLPGYIVIYTDVTDGDRISEGHRNLLRKAEVELTLEDAYPDVLLWNEYEDAFWVIEAVTSDGEVDQTKVEAVKRTLKRRGRTVQVGFTTAYQTWQDAASRQAGVGNLAPYSYMWILGDAARHLRVEVDPVPKKDSTRSSGSL